MLEQGGGNIINISSAAADSGYPSPYGGTKQAVEALTAGFANELKARDVVVKALKPTSIIETPGYLFAQVPRDETGSESYETLPPDSYVEAAILLALQTTGTFTGRVHNDAQVIGHLADDDARRRFRDLNPSSWSTIMDNVTPGGDR
jgi:NAD(P)-dependent dehydrogenase (short-subunit alcohol dehydrogenase family)